MPLYAQDIYLPGVNLAVREFVDPILELFVDSIAHPLYPVLQILILSVGSIVAAHSFGFSKSATTVAGLLTGSLCLLCVGLDPLLLHVHWFSWLLAAHINLIRRDTHVARIIALGASILWIVSAGPQAIFGLLLVLAICIWFSARVGTIGAYLTGSGAGTLRSACPLLLTSIVVTLAIMPAIPFPQLPGTARLVPELRDGFAIRPLLGAYQPIQSIEVGAFGMALWRYAAGICFSISVLAGLLFWNIRSVRSVDTGRMIAASLPLLVLALLILGGYRTVHSNTALTVHSLLASIVPGLALIPLPWSTTVLLITSACILLAADMPPRINTAATLVSLIATVLFALRSDFVAVSVTEATAQPSFASSVSGYVVQSQGAWTAEPKAAVNRSPDRLDRVVPHASEEWSVTASVEPQDAGRIIDGSDFTSWKTKRGQQIGDSITLRFSQPIAVIRAVLMTKRSRGKYPEGLEVRYRDIAGAWHVVSKQVPWLGPVRFSPESFPYFGSPDHVVIDFPQEVLATGIVFAAALPSQREWSVDEVRFYSFKK